MTDDTQTFRPPTDWEAVYAADPDGWTFGEEPSAIARSALRYYEAFGGDPSHGVALDLGSGEGRDTAFLAAAGFHVVARDLAPTGLAKTQTLLAQSGVPLSRVDMAIEDVRGFAYPTGAYDIALAANVFQFLAPTDAPLHIRRLQGAVRPGGLCAVGVFSPEMKNWGAQLDGHFTATGRELEDFFPADAGWLVLDRTEYAVLRMPQRARMSFAFVVARKEPPAP